MDWPSNARRVFYFKLAFLAFALVLLASCGSPKSSTNKLPEVQDPTVKPQETLQAPPTNTTDSRLPDLSTAVSINLTDKTNYQDLINLAGNIYLPLVGDPKISMKITNSRSQSISGSVLVAFEDRLGFWGALLNSFETTGKHIGNNVDMIFADNELVIRTTGTLSGDDFNGNIYYRVRQSGDTQCKKVTVTCNIIDAGWGYPAPTCNYPTPDYITPCTNYMDTTNSNVKKLGTFKSKYSTWATLPEGQ